MSSSFIGNIKGSRCSNGEHKISRSLFDSKNNSNVCPVFVLFLPGQYYCHGPRSKDWGVAERSIRFRHLSCGGYRGKSYEIASLTFGSFREVALVGCIKILNQFFNYLRFIYKWASLVKWDRSLFESCSVRTAVYQCFIWAGDKMVHALYQMIIKGSWLVWNQVGLLLIIATWVILASKGWYDKVYILNTCLRVTWTLFPEVAYIFLSRFLSWV
jgi:hypothetical protein